MTNYGGICSVRVVMKLRLLSLIMLAVNIAAAADQPGPAALAAAVLQRYATYSIPERQAAIEACC